MFSAIRKMEALRDEYAVFDAEADTWLLHTGSDHVLGIGRYYRGEKLLALFNFDHREQTAWVQDQSLFTDLFTGEEQDAGAVKLPPCGFRWLLQKM